MRRSLITAAATLAAAVAIPAAADAATIHQDGKRPYRFLLQDTAGDANHLTVSGSKHIVFQDATGTLAAWTLNDTAITGGGTIGNAGAGWSFLG